jgi:hypothetical protein
MVEDDPDADHAAQEEEPRALIEARQAAFTRMMEQGRRAVTGRSEESSR